jgi:HAD superfamily hydrolase (TIGR01509 family)
MKAIIFDLDGVLVSTDILHQVAIRMAVLDLTNIDINNSNIISEKSMSSTKEKIKIIQSSYDLSNEVYEEIIKLKDKLFFNLVNNIAVKNNIIDCLEYIKTLNIKTAIASNSRLINIRKILSTTDIEKYFDIVVSAEEVLYRKPAPDILFEVYKRLRLTEDETYQTLFIEDTEEGAQAGYNSHSTVLKINSPEDLTVNLIKDFI